MTIPILEKIEPVKRLWQTMLPSIPVPDVQQFVFWIEKYNDADITHAVVRAAKKHRRGELVPETREAVRYVSGILLNQAKVNRARLERAVEREKERGSR